MNEAIRLAKEDLGPDALILEVRRVPNSDVSAGRQGEVEISAMSDDAPAPMTAPVSDEPDIEEIARRTQALRGYGASARASGRQQMHTSGTPTTQAVGAYLQQLGLQAPLPERIAGAYLASSTQGEAREAISLAIQAAGVVSRQPIVSEGRQIVALVGPSGVGKTTTIAKLAAVISRVQDRKVVVVTTDTFRVGAVVQLRTFAEILGIPFYSAADRDELQYVLNATADVDAVFVDTPGVNPYKSDLMKDLRDLIGTRDPLSCYLTVAMTGDFPELVQVGRRYGLLNPNGLIVTKVDETMRAPMLVGLAQQVQLPLTYVCAGQEIPDDITLATPELLADLLIQVLERLQ
jgi:flagellar biosynthesis protein FlhF